MREAVTEDNDNEGDNDEGIVAVVLCCPSIDDSTTIPPGSDSS